MLSLRSLPDRCCVVMSMAEDIDWSPTYSKLSGGFCVEGCLDVADSGRRKLFEQECICEL
jgi:hypothetical protein